jgi:hypothetical protein
MLDLLNRIGEILGAEKNDAQLDKYLDQVRESYAGTNRQFIRYQVATISSLVAYHLIVYGGATFTPVGGVQLTDSSLFRQTFLVFPSALLAASASVGYLRMLQREVYDYLTISRYRILAKTGLHEFRLPGDFILGLFILHIEGGRIGKIVSLVVATLSLFSFFIAPAVYILNESIRNVLIFGWYHWICVTATAISIILSVSSLIIIRLSHNVQVALSSKRLR